MTNFNKRICFNINVPVCPTYGTRFKDLCLSFFSPLSPATPLCCSEPASRCRTESGVHHCACPPWGNAIFLRVPRWVPALSHFCDKNERSDLVSYGCPCWIFLVLLVWQKSEFMWCVFFFFFFPMVKTLEDSLTSTQLYVFLKSVGIHYRWDLWMFPKFDQNWTAGTEVIQEDLTAWHAHM